MKSSTPPKKTIKWRKSTDKEVEKDMELAKNLKLYRGEVINLIAEIESELDELIVHNFIKNEHKEKFFRILLWDGFSLRTKIRLLGEMPLEEISAKEKKEIISKLHYLINARNSFAHRLSFVASGNAYLIIEDHKIMKIDKEYMEKITNRAIGILWKLRAIHYAQKGITASMLKNAKIAKISINKINI